MTTDTMADEIEGLKTAYGKVSVAAGAPGQTLLRIATVRLPSGCKPAEASSLLVVQEGQRPVLYVTPGILLPNGVAPRSTTSVQVAGTEWMQFSYTFPWDHTTHTLVQFVEASLRRFAKNE